MVFGRIYSSKAVKGLNKLNFLFDMGESFQIVFFYYQSIKIEIEILARLSRLSSCIFLVMFSKSNKISIFFVNINFPSITFV